MENTTNPTDQSAAVFDLEQSDDELLKLVQPAIKESLAYWNGKDQFNLEETVKENMDLWLGKHWKEDRVYDYQRENLYVDNRIFSSTETIVEIVNSRIANPEIFPAQNTVTSKQLAKDVQSALTAHSSKHRTIDIFRSNTRNLLLKRRAYIKLRYDPLFGKIGDIVPELVDPSDVIIDKDAKMYDNPRFIAHKLKGKSVEELCAQFPDSEQKVYAAFGINRMNKKGERIAYKTQMRKQMDIYEIWFTYWEDKQPKEGVLWCDMTFGHVFGKIRNPNYNYEDEGFDEMAANILDMPLKPFIPFNHLNDGSSAVDLTSLPEQAKSLQKILDKRGFQIMENADQAGSGIVFNTTMITKEDMSKLIGAPDERIGVKGKVGDAIQRIAPNQLPEYVLQDKYDARQAMDNIFGTHEVTRGENSSNKTLGQDMMQSNQDLSRQEGLARAAERSATLYYRYLVQMMKVYYTEEHWFKITGEDGQFDFVVMKSDLIEDGIEINVEVGSTLPMDKMQLKNSAMKLATAGFMDPLTLYEILEIPNAKKAVQRLMKFTTDPMSFLADIDEEDFSREAVMDITVLVGGQAPKQRDEYQPSYFNFMNNYMITGEFEGQPPLVKQLFVEHLRMAQMQASKQLQAMMTQMPTSKDMDASNQQALKQAELEGQMMNAAPQSEVPANAQQFATDTDQQLSEMESNKEAQAQPVM